MNYKMILRLICYILRVEAVCLVPPLGISLFLGESDAILGTGLTILLCGALSLTTCFLPPRTKEISPREGFLSVALCWVVVSLAGGLPFFFSGAIPNFIDCFFETVSGFTTTGSSILTDVEAMPKGLLYWRSFTHWLGGMGVLVFLLAVVPMGRGRNSLLHVMRAESPGPQVDKLVPTLQKSAKILYTIYICLTVVQILLLLAGGMPLFDSLTISFGTAGTGGFAIKNDSMAGYSPYLQNVCTVFMALFGINFSVFYLILLRQWKRVCRNEELWLYLGIMALATGLIAWDILPQYSGDLGVSLRHAAFQVSSIMTTTGFATTDFNLWPPFSKMILVTLMIVGACAGSTGGGIKAARVLLLFKSGRRSLKRIIRPRQVAQVHVDGQLVDESVIHNTYSYMVFYSITAILSMLVVALDEQSLETTITGVLTCLNNVGPGMDMVGPMSNFAHLSWLSKLVLSFDMLLGRLEIFPMLLLFMPGAWKRS